MDFLITSLTSYSWSVSVSRRAVPCETISASDLWGSIVILNLFNKWGAISIEAMSSTAPTVIKVCIANLLLTASLLMTYTSKSMRRFPMSNGITGNAVVITI